MKLEYLSYTEPPYHCIGFSRFGPDRKVKVDDAEWNNVLDTVATIPFFVRTQTLRSKTLESIDQEVCGSPLACEQSPRTLLYSSDNNDEVGVGFCKIPIDQGCNRPFHYRENVKRVNKLMFDEIAKVADQPSYNVYLKLLKEGLLPILERVSLQDRCKLIVVDFPAEFKEELPSFLQKELKLLEFYI